jgi:hypothetical protein
MTIDAFGGNGGSMNGNPDAREAQIEKRVTAPAQGAFRIAIGGGGSTAGMFGTGGAGGAGGGANGAAAGGAGGSGANGHAGGAGGGGATGVYLSSTDLSVPQSGANRVVLAPRGGGASAGATGVSAGEQPRDTTGGGACKGGSATWSGNGNPDGGSSCSGNAARRAVANAEAAQQAAEQAPQVQARSKRWPRGWATSRTHSHD